MLALLLIKIFSGTLTVVSSRRRSERLAPRPLYYGVAVLLDTLISLSE
jgi:hypothetical protein